MGLRFENAEPVIPGTESTTIEEVIDDPLTEDEEDDDEDDEEDEDDEDDEDEGNDPDEDEPELEDPPVSII